MNVVDDYGRPISEKQSKRILAGVLAILLGSLGIHKFILGYNKEGIIMILLSTVLMIFTCGFSLLATELISLIEGIIYLTKTDEQFIHEYQVHKKPWF